MSFIAFRIFFLTNNAQVAKLDWEGWLESEKSAHKVFIFVVLSLSCMIVVVGNRIMVHKSHAHTS